MKNREVIKEHIRQSLKSKEGETVCLVGSWGCGKTHMWRELEKEFVDSLYVSIFGCNDIQELKRRIFTKYFLVKKKDPKKSLSELFKDKGIELLTEGVKGALRAADSYLGLNLITFNTEILNLIDDGIVICIDDFERKGPDLSIQEVFGVIDYLSVQKNIKILLVLNESFKEDHQIFKEYAEKISQTYLKAEADIQSSFDLFVSSLKNKNFFIENRNNIITIFEKSQTGNLRVLKRLVWLIDNILANQIALRSEHAASLAIYLIEWSKGKLKEEEFYCFSGGSLGFGDTGDDAERKELLENYLIDIYEYKHVSALYHYIAKSYCDYSALKDEILPPVKVFTKEEAIVAKVTNYDWFNITLSEAKSLKTELYLELTKSHDKFTAKQLFVMTLYHEYLLEGISLKFPVEEKTELAKVFYRKGSAGDLSIDPNLTMFYMHFRKYWEHYYEEYSKGSFSFRTNELKQVLLDDIKAENYRNLMERYLDKDAIQLLSNDLFSEIESKRLSAPSFFHKVIHLLYESLKHKNSPEEKENFLKLQTFLEEKIKIETDSFELKRLKHHFKNV